MGVILATGGRVPGSVGTDPNAPEDLPTRAYLGSTGIVLNATDAEGVRWTFDVGSAWGAKPAPREDVGDRPYDHGQWDASEYYGPRLMAISGLAHAPDHVALHRAEVRLKAAVTVKPFVYRVTEPGYDGWAMVRQSGPVEWTERTRGVGAFSLGLYAPDPLIYSAAQTPFQLAFPTINGGRTWPTTWPGSWVTESVGSSVALTNSGSEPAPLVMRITGPRETVTIAFPETGEALHLVNPDGPLLRDGEFLTVDTGLRRVLLMGQENASRYSWAYGSFLHLPPGATTRIAVGGKGVASPASSVTGHFYTARI